jgi:Transposase
MEVDRPNRQRRRRQGKTDPHDAVTAARAAQAGDALGVAKIRDGNVEAIRVLRVVRCGAKRDRTRAINQMRSLVSTAPDDLRQQLRGLTIPKLVRRAAALRPGGRSDVTAATRLALRTLAHRVLELNTEVAALDNVLKPLVAATAPELVAQVGVGTDTAGALLVAAGENTSRPPQPTLLRPAVRRRPTRRVIRQATTPPTQPRRRPPSQLGAVADRDRSALPRPGHTPLPPPPPRRRQDQSRSNPLPQALRRPRALPPAPTRTTGLTPPRSNNWCAAAPPTGRSGLCCRPPISAAAGRCRRASAVALRRHGLRRHGRVAAGRRR